MSLGMKLSKSSEARFFKHYFRTTILESTLTVIVKHGALIGSCASPVSWCAALYHNCVANMSVRVYLEGMGDEVNNFLGDVNNSLSTMMAMKKQVKDTHKKCNISKTV